MLEVAAVNVDLGEDVEDSRILTTSADASLIPRKAQLQPVARPNLLDQRIDREVARHRCQKRLDSLLVAVGI